MDNTFNSSYNSLDISGTKDWKPTPRKKAVKRQREPITTNNSNISYISSSSSSPRGRMRSLSPINNVTSSPRDKSFSSPKTRSSSDFVYHNPVRQSLVEYTPLSQKIHSSTVFSSPKTRSSSDFVYHNPVRQSLVEYTPSPQKIHSSTVFSSPKTRSSSDFVYHNPVQSTPSPSFNIETRRYHSGNNYSSSTEEPFFDYHNPVRSSLVQSTTSPPQTHSSPITFSQSRRNDSIVEEKSGYIQPWQNSHSDLGFLSKKKKKKKSSSKKKKKRSKHRKY